MRIFSRVAQLVVVALLVVVTVSMVRAARQGAAQPTFAGASGSPDLVLGPAGIGKLRLGMSEKEAAATGQVKDYSVSEWKGDSKCAFQTVDGVSIAFSRDHGLAVITVVGTARTPQGVRVGASVDQVANAYPTLNHPDLGTAREQVQLIGQFTTPVPGNPDALYAFVFNLGGSAPPATAKLQYILLSLRKQDQECTRAD